MPAAVPLTAAITGTSQSRSAREQRVLPVEHHPARVADDPLGDVVGPVVLVDVGEVGTGAEELLARPR